jgi:ABC-type transport system involved in cytochrome bd biosynthesis fused ATPase/permease subunit
MKSIKKHAAGKTVVIVSNIFDVISVSDNVIVMNKGEVVYKGPSSHLNRESALYDMMVDAEL